jgi:cytochrome c oxidase subunit 2
MLAPVNVLSQSEFDAWVLSQTGPVSDDPVERGQIFAQQFGCLACHSIDGSQLVGPTWLGVFGSTEMLDDGSSMLVDGNYLFKSIRDPGIQIVAGFQNLMPEAIGNDMTDEQIEDVIAFIESLK